MKISKNLVVLYEDNHLIAVNKPNGVLVHEAKDSDITLEDMVKDYIKNKYKKPGDVYLGTLHRIDRPTSGIVIFAKTSKAAARMSGLFSTGKIDKEYLAIVDHIPHPFTGRLEHYLVKNTEKNVTKAYDNPKNGSKKAVLEYELVGEINKNVLMSIKIFTGRAHQIRVQLKKIGIPINGDVKYGSDLVFSDQSIALHARKMSFMHPVKQELVSIKANPPKNIVWNEFLGLMKQENK